MDEIIFQIENERAPPPSQSLEESSSCLEEASPDVEASFPRTRSSRALVARLHEYGNSPLRGIEEGPLVFVCQIMGFPKNPTKIENSSRPNPPPVLKTL